MSGTRDPLRDKVLEEMDWAAGQLAALLRHLRSWNDPMALTFTNALAEFNDTRKALAAPQAKPSYMVDGMNPPIPPEVGLIKKISAILEQAAIDWSERHADAEHEPPEYYARQIAALSAPSGWISVKERLPEKYGPVVGCEHGEVATYWWGPESDCEPAFTHWMPLPAAPKEGSE